MTAEYIPPLVFHRWETTREGPPFRRRPPEPIEAWVPRRSQIPAGITPQAVRLIRDGQPAATLRLLSSQAYQIGRIPSCQLLFEHSSVSRLHGLLYFSSEISCWVYRDPMSTTGTFVSRSDVPGKREKISHQWPIAIVAGHTIELGNASNRLEFLDRVPWEAAGTSGKVRWRSEAARELELSVLDAAGKQGPVLLFGPSGSGKTFLASRIHELSGRKGSYVELNCGRLPRDSNQLQSELLGHVKGAFTGAIGRRDGALFEADKGTLFLDEVESLPPEAQVFLLDVLEGTAPLRPLGADKGVQRPSVRFICSTKVPLNQTTLREDLVNRLVRGHRIIIPSLAERREDIPILIDSILQVIKAEAGAEATVTKEAMQFLMAQDWPGHVRQLKDALYSTTDGHHGAHIEIGVETFQRYLAGEAIVRGGLPDRFDSTIEPTEPGTTPVPVIRKRPVDLTRDDLEKALHAAGGVMKRAAEMLGCSPTTLRAKRREFGL